MREVRYNGKVMFSYDPSEENYALTKACGGATARWQENTPSILSMQSKIAKVPLNSEDIFAVPTCYNEIPKELINMYLGLPTPSISTYDRFEITGVIPSRPALKQVLQAGPVKTKSQALRRLCDAKSY
jgi:hypothetical protein